MSDHTDRLDGCKVIVKEGPRSVGECWTYAYYELRAPQNEQDKENAQDSKIICESDVGKRPYDGKEFVRLTAREAYLTAEIRDAAADRKDEIDDIEIERLQDELVQVRAERAKMEVAR